MPSSPSTLLIVESPAKCSKIQGFLGPGYTVLASMGHIRKLKDDLDAVGITRNWDPIYETIESKTDTIQRLQKAARAASIVMLASDDDPEGEAIAWHVCLLLKLPVATTPRVIFHEITADVVRSAVASPRTIDMNRVNSQQARAMLDLLIGFSVSPLLWKFGRGLSAGRCQTPALRLLCETEDEIETFKSSSSFPAVSAWNYGKATFNSSLVSPSDAMASYDAAAGFMKQLATYSRTGTVLKVVDNPSISATPEPFITASLQQVASSRLGMSPAITMRAAQKLYEAGLITYMRTDSTALAEEAVAEIKGLVVSKFGKEFSNPSNWSEVVISKKRGGGGAAAAAPVHAAHEAIRPTHMDVEDGGANTQEMRLYALIWKRTMQSQMAAARSTVKRATISTTAPDTTWAAQWERLDFPGWKILETAAATADSDAEDAPPSAEAFAAVAALKVGDKLPCKEITITEKISQPPARYTEASLINELKRRGIGRPATFAHILDSVLERRYAVKETRPGITVPIREITWVASKPIKETTANKVLGRQTNKLFVTDIGRTVALFLTERFTNVFDYNFTSNMNAGLDLVAKGDAEWKTLLKDAWEELEPLIKEAKKDASEEAKAHRAATKAALAAGELPPDTDRCRYLDAEIKVVQTRYGPRYAIPVNHEWLEDSTAEVKGEVRFINMLPGTLFETVTLEDAEEAVAAVLEQEALEDAENGPLGGYDGHAIILKTGPFGRYLQAGDIKVTLTAAHGDVISREDAIALITSKAIAYRRDLTPDISVRQGARGYYIMGPPGAKGGKPTFRKLPEGEDPDKITLAKCREILTSPPASHRRRIPAKGAKKGVKK